MSDATPAVPLPELVEMLRDIAYDIDLVDEEILGRRHTTNDPGVGAQLRGAGDDLTQAWTAVRRAMTTLTNLGATT